MKKLREMEFFKDRKVRIWAAVAAIFLFLAGSAVLIWILSAEMFTSNPRFILRHVRVASHDKGFWKGRKELVCDILHIREGMTNIFSLDPGELRQRLLAREPSIQSVRIIRELPDTLYVNIVERTPVARVNTMKSPLLVDSNTILMQKNRCMDIASTLPVIFGLPNVSSYPPGSTIHHFKAAVKLIVLTQTTYPDFRIGVISVKHKGQLIYSVYYKDNPLFYRVVMPDRNLTKNLQVLAATLEELAKTRNHRRNINLLFRNQVIITGESEPNPKRRKRS